MSLPILTQHSHGNVKKDKMLQQSGLYYPLIKNKLSNEDSFEKKNIFKFNESKIQGKSNNIGKFKKDEKNKHQNNINNSNRWIHQNIHRPGSKSSSASSATFTSSYNSSLLTSSTSNFATLGPKGCNCDSIDHKKRVSHYIFIKNQQDNFDNCCTSNKIVYASDCNYILTENELNDLETQIESEDKMNLRIHARDEPTLKKLRDCRSSHDFEGNGSLIVNQIIKQKVSSDNLNEKFAGFVQERKRQKLSHRLNLNNNSTTYFIKNSEESSLETKAKTSDFINESSVLQFSISSKFSVLTLTRPRSTYSLDFSCRSKLTHENQNEKRDNATFISGTQAKDAFINLHEEKYDVDDFPHYICPICIDVLTHPVSLKGCNHVFCRLCLFEMIQVTLQPSKFNIHDYPVESNIEGHIDISLTDNANQDALLNTDMGSSSVSSDMDTSNAKLEVENLTSSTNQARLLTNDRIDAVNRQSQRQRYRQERNRLYNIIDNYPSFDEVYNSENSYTPSCPMCRKDIDKMSELVKEKDLANEIYAKFPHLVMKKVQSTHSLAKQKELAANIKVLADLLLDASIEYAKVYADSDESLGINDTEDDFSSTSSMMTSSSSSVNDEDSIGNDDDSFASSHDTNSENQAFEEESIDNNTHDTGHICGNSSNIENRAISPNPQDSNAPVSEHHRGNVVHQNNNIQTSSLQDPLIIQNQGIRRRRNSRRSSQQSPDQDVERYRANSSTIASIPQVSRSRRRPRRPTNRIDTDENNETKLFSRLLHYFTSYNSTTDSTGDQRSATDSMDSHSIGNNSERTETREDRNNTNDSTEGSGLHNRRSARRRNPNINPRPPDSVPPLSSLRMIRRRRRLQERRHREALLGGLEVNDIFGARSQRRRNRRRITQMVESIFPSWLTSRVTMNRRRQRLRQRNRERIRTDEEEYFLLSVELVCLLYAVICFALLLWFRILTYYL